MSENEFLPKNCPNCDTRLTVVDTRAKPGMIERQRICQACGYRCTTEEKVRKAS